MAGPVPLPFQFLAAWAGVVADDVQHLTAGNGFGRVHPNL